MKKQIVTFFTVVCMVFMLIPSLTFGASVTNSGTFGNNMSWQLDSDGTLTISGSGAMPDFDWQGAPWKSQSSYIKKAVISSGITSIGEYCFFNCWKMVSISIPDSINSIGDYAFYRCTNINNINIPNNVTYIGAYAFSNCSALTNITLSTNLNSIEQLLFSGCTALNSIDIPTNVSNIDYSAFSGCTSLSAINVSSYNNYYSSINGVLFSKDNKKLLKYPKGKTNSSYTVPSGVTEIESSAFSGCELTSISLPNSLLAIGDGAFSSCETLRNITIPYNITSIESYTFYGCKSLTNITIPNSVTSIGYYAFADTAITSIVIPDSVQKLGSQLFYNCSDLEHITLGSGISSIPWSMFCHCKNLIDITIPDGVTEIGSYAFFDCSSLKSITIPHSVTQIKNAAFTNCSSLTDIYYNGTESEWNSIEIDTYEGYDGGDQWVSNSAIINAQKHFISLQQNFTVNYSGNTATVTNTSDSSQTADIIIADYSTDGSLNTIGTYKQTVFNSGASQRYTLPTNGKIFVWNSIERMYPLNK